VTRRKALIQVGLLVAALALAATPFISPGVASASVGTWSTPAKLSTSDMKWAWFPSVAADDSGNVHVVFSNGNGGLATGRFDVNELRYTRTANGQMWSDPNDLAVVTSSDAMRNSITVDSAGRLHLIYKGWGSLEPPPNFNPPNGLGPEDLWYMSTAGTSGQSVSSWSPAKRITTSTVGYYADLAIDSHGVLHLIWTEIDQFGWGIYYAHSSNGGTTWSERVPIDTDHMVWWFRAHLNVDSADHLHIVWEVTDPEYLSRTLGSLYAESTDGGQTWTRVFMGGQVPQTIPGLKRTAGTPQPTPGSQTSGLAGKPSGTPQPAQQTPAPQAGSNARVPNAPQQPAIGVDGTGQRIFVYRDSDTTRILYRLSLDGSFWSPPQPLPGVRIGVDRPYDIYDMVTDSAGHVHLAFVGFADGSETESLMLSEWDGRVWTNPQVVVAAPPFPEYPKLAISNGNRLHLVWFDGDITTVDRVPVGVYYSSALTSAPRVTSAARAVPIPAIQAPTPLAVPRGLNRRVPVTQVALSQQLAGGMPPSPDSISNRLRDPAIAILVPAAVIVLVVGIVALKTLELNPFRRGDRF